MKKCFAALALLSLLLLSSCSVPYPVIDSLGENCTGTIWHEDSFQDFTDYGKFHCPGVSAEQLERNAYFSAVTQENLPMLQGYLENFASWIALMEDDQEPKIHYDFSADVVNPGDYFCLEEKGPQPYTNYDLYYFDLETQTLYYFHSNI